VYIIADILNDNASNGLNVFIIFVILYASLFSTISQPLFKLIKSKNTLVVHECKNINKLRNGKSLRKHRLHGKQSVFMGFFSPNILV